MPSHFQRAKAASSRQHKAAMTKEQAFHEVKHNPPKILKHTAQKFGKADAKRQAVAIALNKSRRK